MMVENTHDLQTHVKHWCPKSSKRTTDRSDDDEGSTKRTKYERPSSWESVASMDGRTDDEEDVVFAKFVDVARGNNEKEWQRKRDKYVKSGLSESKAEWKADSRLEDDDMKECMEEYGKLLLSLLRLRRGRLHTEIMESIDGYIGDGIDRNRAIRMVLRKYKPEFEEYPSAIGDTEEDGQDDSDTEDDGDTESTVDEESDTDS